MRFDGELTERESQSETAPAGSAIALHLRKALEDALPFGLWNTGTGVGHADLYLRGSQYSGDADIPALRRILDRIVHQVCQDPLYFPLIDCYQRQGMGNDGAQGDLAAGL